MSLSCNYDDSGDFEYYFEETDDFIPFQENRRKRCCSCKELINKGALAVRFNRWHYPKDDIEERIYGDGGIYMAPLWMCESCGDQYFNLTELKFCITPTDNMFELLKEYQEEYGKKIA
jgi:hypothetical protein